MSRPCPIFRHIDTVSILISSTKHVRFQSPSHWSSRSTSVILQYFTPITSNSNPTVRVSLFLLMFVLQKAFPWAKRVIRNTTSAHWISCTSSLHHLSTNWASTNILFRFLASGTCLNDLQRHKQYTHHTSSYNGQREIIDNAPALLLFNHSHFHQQVLRHLVFAEG